MTNAKNKIDLYRTAHAAALESLNENGHALEKAVHAAFGEAAHDPIDYPDWRAQFDNVRELAGRLSREKTVSQRRDELANA
jgi:S-methylmethionine-dependent homocysteine/selenocysteine methylase